MLNFQAVMQLIGRWGGTLNYFPSDPEARIGIAEEIVSMASAEEQVRWLVARMPKLFKDWPAMHEVRAVFCSKYKPKDGIEVYSSVYVDGVPSEKESLPALAAPARLQLPAGEPVSAAESINATVADLARKTSLVRVLANAPSPKVREIPVVRLTAENLLTAADLERAAQEYRAKKAAEEVKA